MAQQRRGCLAAVFDLFFGDTSRRQVAAIPAVRINQYFVSPAEADFFRVLTRVVRDRGHILSQVSLRQLIWFPGGNRSNPGRTTWQNKMAQRSIDFLICDCATLKPIVAIELDEPSHAEARRQTRDDEVEAILEAAKLPVIRVLTSRSYDMRELEAALAEYLPG